MISLKYCCTLTYEECLKGSLGVEIFLDAGEDGRESFFLFGVRAAAVPRAALEVRRRDVEADALLPPASQSSIVKRGGELFPLARRGPLWGPNLSEEYVGF